MQKKKLVVLTGAGISAESGISTFRDAGGLWEGHDVRQVASPEGFLQDPDLVHEFYNLRRRELLKVQPNPAHEFLAELEKDFQVNVITQNVDDLHERAGSTHVIHLHGELLKIQSLKDPAKVISWRNDLTKEYQDEEGHNYRPFIVWFGEAVPKLEEAIIHYVEADICVVIGTSLQVYPAAGLLEYCRPEIPIFYVDPHPGSTSHFSNRHKTEVIAKKAVAAVPILRKKLSEFI